MAYTKNKSDIKKYIENFVPVKLLKKDTIIYRDISTANSYKGIEKGEKIPIVYDVMFKCMLGNESRKGYLIVLLNAIFKYFDIEVNNNASSADKYLIERNIRYAFQISNSMIKKGDADIKFIPIIQVNLNNFTIKGEDRSAVLYCISDNEGIPLIDSFLTIEIYLPNIRKKWYNISRREELKKLRN